MAGTLTRTVSGLILREGFEADNGWNAETGWNRQALPSLVTWGKTSGIPILEPGASGTFDRDGVREPVPIIADSKSYLNYDAGDGTAGITPCIAVSTNRFYSFDERYSGIAERDNGSGGEWPAVASGWISKWGDTWYAHRITCGLVEGPPEQGLPAGDFGWDIWTASAIDGTWTYVRTVPLGTGGSWCDAQLLPCSYVLVDGTYYHFPEGARAAEQFKIGLATSTSPSGVVTIGSPILSGANFYGHHPENARIFRCQALGVWALSVNLIDPGGEFTGRNGIAINTSTIGDWSGVTTYTTQHYYALCDGEDVVGIATPFTGPDGTTFEEDGFIPGTFDTDPVDGNHIGRKCYGLVWESSSHALCFANATTTRYRYYKTLAHSDFVCEFALCFPAGPVADSDVSFEFRCTGSNGYRAVFGNSGTDYPKLEKLDGTLVSAGGIAIDAGVSNRIMLEANGTIVRIWINGQLQFTESDVTDYASGTQIAFSAKTCDAQVRLFSMTTVAPLTITGLDPGNMVFLRTHGGVAALVATESIVDASSTLTVEVPRHYPLSRLEYPQGVDTQTSDRLIWRGDTLVFAPDPEGPGSRAGMM